jgi:putative membrane-bound dehydrogenase-like protein
MHRRLVASCFFLLLVAFPVGGQDRPIPPERAVERMKVPEGFRVTLVAGEPQLIKPMAMTTDDRGRLWVVESHSYPKWHTDGKPGQDRILIFEDKGDGRFEGKVFWDRGTNLSGIAVGFGGVWLCAIPHLLFVPLAPGEDRPAGPPEVVLDGWSMEARHNVVNGLTWGPDGWLYGLNGILSSSRVGRPGTPDKERVALNCGVWRYHPTRKRVEVVASGTTNPWGLDFDDFGEMFITNCVIKHLFHVVPGGRYQRMFGQDLAPHTYGLMASCADHIHWGGGDWTSSRGGKGAHDAPGGGHAHAGALVYLGDNWPDEYRNRVFMCNIHGNRLNQDVLERQGSGYVAHHGTDFLLANDPWFRGLGLHAAADGGVFVSDWHDTGECHNYDKVHPSGRVYKITYGRPARKPADLAVLGDDELVRLQLHRDDWQVRHARRLLQERAHAGTLSAGVRPALLDMLRTQKDVTRQLRALWALHVTGGLDDKALLGLCGQEQEMVGVWAVRLLVEEGRASDEVAARLAEMARKDGSPAVRLAVASGLRRLPPEKRWPIAEGLAGHAEDGGDANLPLMIWYGVEPLAADPDRAASLLAKARIPLVRQHLSRRIASLADGPAASGTLEPLVRILTASDDAAMRRDVVRGMHEALQGRREVATPPGWAIVYRKLSAGPDREVQEKALQLSVLFGDPQALAELRKVAADPKADEGSRRGALQALVDRRAEGVPALLRDLVVDRALRGAALRALAGFADAGTPTLILRHYPSFTDAEKADAVATLASRPEYALALLDAMEKGQVPRRDLSVFTARQLLTLRDARLTGRLNKVWGTLRPPARDRAALLARYQALVAPDKLKKANRSQGRLVFTKTCAACHTLFGEGAKIGPDLTGSQRANPEYILTKVLDPSAVVARDYQMTVLTTADGRTLSGLVKEEDDKLVLLQTPTELLRIRKADVEERRRSELSLMPDGILAPLSDTEVCDLVGYLAGPGQVPLPESKAPH